METQKNSSDPPLTSKELVVFAILRDSKCAGCSKVLWKGDFLFLEGGQPLCLGCADLDHLVYLPRGDAALTRRAKKYSALSAVVVRFSWSRGRYERQGILAGESALARAEDECLADAQRRALRCSRDEQRRAEQDRDLAARMTEAILELFPGCPSDEARAIAAHTAVRGSGRGRRTSAGRALEAEALTAAVVASVRHNHTRYDQLLMNGWSRIDARDAIRDAVDRVIKSWRCPTRLPLVRGSTVMRNGGTLGHVRSTAGRGHIDEQVGYRRTRSVPREVCSNRVTGKEKAFAMVGAVRDARCMGRKTDR